MDDVDDGEDDQEGNATKTDCILTSYYETALCKVSYKNFSNKVVCLLSEQPISIVIIMCDNTYNQNNFICKD